jgi:hypothetical protein
VFLPPFDDLADRRDLPRRGGDRQAAHDAADLGVDQGRSMDAAREALTQQ